MLISAIAMTAPVVVVLLKQFRVSVVAIDIIQGVLSEPYGFKMERPEGMIITIRE
ncbi:hypothetical protein MCAMS1_02572 [biofilm metagenome]